MINAITTNNKWKGLCYKIAPALGADLYQEFILIVLEYPQDKLMDVWQNKKFDFWALRTIRNMYNSSTSPFYKKYKKRRSQDSSKYDVIPVVTNKQFLVVHLLRLIALAVKKSLLFLEVERQL